MTEQPSCVVVLQANLSIQSALPIAGVVSDIDTDEAIKTGPLLRTKWAVLYIGHLHHNPSETIQAAHPPAIPLDFDFCYAKTFSP
jgi:hypothetical protein